MEAIRYVAVRALALASLLTAVVAIGRRWEDRPAATGWVRAGRAVVAFGLPMFVFNLGSRWARGNEIPTVDLIIRLVTWCGTAALFAHVLWSGRPAAGSARS
jgi:hypothetical protein